MAPDDIFMVVSGAAIYSPHFHTIAVFIHSSPLQSTRDLRTSTQASISLPYGRSYPLDGTSWDGGRESGHPISLMPGPMHDRLVNLRWKAISQH